MGEWLQANGGLLGGLGFLSLAFALGSLFVVPAIVASLPVDYFLRTRRVPLPWAQLHPVLDGLVVLVKNAAGVLFLLAGVAMLVLPGQGILTILIGLSLLDFPGKFALQRRLALSPSVLRALNWIRARAGKPPLESPPGPR